MIGSLDGARIVNGGSNAMTEITNMVAGAESTLSAEVFIMKEQAVQGSFQSTLQKDGFTAELLLDPENSTTGLKGAGLTANTYGASPHKNHAKSLVTDYTNGLVTTAAINDRTHGRKDLTAVFQGDAARALDELTRAGVADDTPRMAAAALDAASHGIVVNDPRSGSRYLTKAVYDMVDNSRETLHIATKRYESPELEAKVAAAKARGVKVYTGAAASLHGNVMVADMATSEPSAYFGTAHFSKRSLTGGGSSGRISRELGIFTRDPQAVSQIDQAMSEMSMRWTESRTATPRVLPKGLIIGGAATAVAAAGVGAYLLFGRGGDVEQQQAP
ncbi:MAG: hypothetical protein JWM90_1561 [Thermoleophilia bacterium]|nr:hypothetical protein [Thermoleophilia bacterium]